MAGRRVDRVRDLIREEISRLLLFKVKEPGLEAVSVTEVRLTADLRRARIMYSVYDDRQDREEVRKRLERVSPFLRRELGRVAGLKFVPELFFEYDHSMEYAQHMDKVLRDVAEADRKDEADDAD